jgi:hypothetical protein
MKFIHPLVVLIAFSAPLAQSGSVRLPRFEDYPAEKIFTGQAAPMKLNNPSKRMYAHEIQEEMKYAYGSSPYHLAGSNFAGHCVVITWSCGAPCLRMAIVDAQTGDIYYPPLTFEDEGPETFDLPLLVPPNSVSQNPEVEFRHDSNLMILKATPKLSRKHPSTFYFLWQRNRWILLRKVPLYSALPAI